MLTTVWPSVCSCCTEFCLRISRVTSSALALFAVVCSSPSSFCTIPHVVLYHAALLPSVLCERVRVRVHVRVHVHEQECGTVNDCACVVEAASQVHIYAHARAQNEVLLARTHVRVS